MARFKESREYLFRGFIVLICLVFLFGIGSDIAKGDENTELLEDFSTRGYILRNCYMVPTLEDLLRLSFITSVVYHYVEVEDRIIVACPAKIYMLVNRENTGKLINCFCLEKMT